VAGSADPEVYHLDQSRIGRRLLDGATLPGSSSRQASPGTCPRISDLANFWVEVASVAAHFPACRLSAAFERHLTRPVAILARNAPWPHPRPSHAMRRAAESPDPRSPSRRSWRGPHRLLSPYRRRRCVNEDWRQNSSAGRDAHYRRDRSFGDIDALVSSGLLQPIEHLFHHFNLHEGGMTVCSRHRGGNSSALSPDGCRVHRSGIDLKPSPRDSKGLFDSLLLGGEPPRALDRVAGRARPLFRQPH